MQFDAVFDIDKVVSRKPDMWRYREALPVNDDAGIVSFGEGFTPLLEFRLKGYDVLIKQDHIFPSGSYKDRGSSLLISQAKSLGITRVVEDSSGNAGASIAAYCARAGIACEIYVPESTSPAKVYQIEAYGARLTRVTGSREDTARAALEAGAETYYASHCWNPFFIHGTKTFAFEICEQLGWRSPDAVVLPAGNGTLLLGAYLGFSELKQANIIADLPRLIAVQASNCAPLHEAFRTQSDEIPRIKAGNTIAEGIAVAEPVRGRQIIEAVRNSGGDIIAVGEDEIKDALAEMWHMGFFIEPTASATIAGLTRYLDQASRDEMVVSTFTGHGLKTVVK